MMNKERFGPVMADPDRAMRGQSTMWSRRRSRAVRHVFALSLGGLLVTVCLSIWLHHLLRRQQQDRALIASIHQGDVAAVKTLLDEGADANVRERAEGTAFGFLDYLRLLLHRQTPAEAALGNPVLITAVSADYPQRAEVVRLLLHKGANANVRSVGDVRNSLRRAPALEVAAACSDSRIVRLLLDAGADFRWKGDDDCSAIHWSTYEGDIVSVQQLLDRGEDVNARGEWGMTPLMEAVWGNHPKVAQLLIARGADVNAVNKQGETAMTIARDDAIVRMLRAAGAKGSPRRHLPVSLPYPSLPYPEQSLPEPPTILHL